MKQKIKHFTLIELYIVIAFYVVLAILGALLIPFFNQAKEKARQADCVSNLSMIGKGFFQYAMSYDDWYPTVRRYRTGTVSTRGYNGRNYKYEKPIDGGKWLGAESYKAFTLLVKQDLLTDTNRFVCPSNTKIIAAKWNEPLSGHVSYQWCDGLMGSDATLSPVATDGADNHASTGRFVRGDGSVGVAIGTRSTKWYQDDSIKKNCKSPSDLPDYSFLNYPTEISF